jgi:hypothetical protein
MTKTFLVHRAFMLFAYLTLGAFALLFSSTSANAQASSSTSNYTETVSPTMYSGCAGQVILTLEGQIHNVFHVTETPSEQRLFRYHTNYQGVTAVDPVGNQYRVSTVNNDTTVLEDSGQREFTIVQYFKLIGKGAAANERVRVINHVTINENGEVTAIFSKFSADCSN